VPRLVLSLWASASGTAGALCFVTDLAAHSPKGGSARFQRAWDALMAEPMLNLWQVALSPKE
jgi:hypothetical protein